MKELLQTSYQMGCDAYPRLMCAPIANKEFMAFVPMSDETYKIRIKMFKSYIKGWTTRHLNDVWEMRTYD